MSILTDAEARAVRLAARELAAECGLEKPCPAVASAAADSRIHNRPFGFELAQLLERWPVLSWVDAHMDQILTRAGVGGAA